MTEFSFLGVLFQIMHITMYPNPYIARLKKKRDPKVIQYLKTITHITTPVTDVEATADTLHVKKRTMEQHILLDTLSEIELLNIIECGHLPL